MWSVRLLPKKTCCLPSVLLTSPWDAAQDPSHPFDAASPPQPDVRPSGHRRTASSTHWPRHQKRRPGTNKVCSSSGDYSNHKHPHRHSHLDQLLATLAIAGTASAWHQHWLHLPNAPSRLSMKQSLTAGCKTGHWREPGWWEEPASPRITRIVVSINFPALPGWPGFPHTVPPGWFIL